MNGKRVIVAPLDWGLGHATRCIPIIEEFKKRNCEVLIASSGSALMLLRKEFPALKFFELASYNVKYPRRTSFALSIFLQIPRILKAISNEHDQLQRIIDEHKIDLVISDNRYGCWSPKIPSVFICHQLNLQFPFGFGWLLFPINYFHHRLIRKFKCVWIPDEPGEGLSGELSESGNLSVKHIGVLSRFKKINAEAKYDLAVILSGPEPQRTILEGILLKQISGQNLKAIIVRGVIENEVIRKQESLITVVNFLQTNELEEVINQSKLIVARSGYSTVMDLAKLGKKAIFIPTPGQPEQEYLGMKLMEDKIALCVSQHKFNLSAALKLSAGYHGFKEYVPNNLLATAMKELL